MDKAISITKIALGLAIMGVLISALVLFYLDEEPKTSAVFGSVLIITYCMGYTGMGKIREGLDLWKENK